MGKIADWMDKAVSSSGNDSVLCGIAKEVAALCENFPVPGIAE